MRLQHVVAAVAAVLTGTVAQGVSAAADQDLSLKEALAAGRLAIVKLAGSTTNDIDLHVRSLGDAPIAVVLHTGDVFESIDPTFQSMMLVKTCRQIIEPRRELVRNLSTYCINAHKKAPAPGVEYRPGREAQGDLYKLAAYLDRQTYTRCDQQKDDLAAAFQALAGMKSILATQFAIWRVSDHLDIEEAMRSPAAGRLIGD